MGGQYKDVCIHTTHTMLQCVYMPRYNIYIRDADKDLWDSIENKSEFISNSLKGTPEKILETPKKVILEQLKKSKVCRKGHFYTGTKCMQKGC